jgi:hypothetical protein
MNQGPSGDCLMKKTEGRKSRDTVPLKRPNPDTDLAIKNPPSPKKTNKQLFTTSEMFAQICQKWQHTVCGKLCG